jgi:ribosomal protein L11 methyltransferase
MFIEIVITEDRERAEALSDALIGSGALSATIEDADAGSTDEQPLYGEPGMTIETSAWKHSRVVALFDAQADVDEAIASASHECGIAPVPPHERREIADANWVGLTQAQFEPIRVGSRLWIVPSWHETPVAAREVDSIVLRLDPGMAFGTGDHPTTRLCLAWLDECMPRDASVIDYGCGSGILAIAAKKLGAGHVAATDIDEQAVDAARTNADDNEVSIEVTLATRFTSPPVDVVVANILSNPLKVLAPLLTSLVADGGWLVLSGVLERQWQEVAERYAPFLPLSCWRVEDGWVCLAGRRTQGR